MPHIKSLFSKFTNSLKSHGHTDHGDTVTTSGHRRNSSGEHLHTTEATQTIEGEAEVGNNSRHSTSPKPHHRHRHHTMGNIFSARNAMQRVVAVPSPTQPHSSFEANERRHPLYNNVAHKVEVCEEYETQTTSHFYDDEVPAGLFSPPLQGVVNSTPKPNEVSHTAGRLAPAPADVDTAVSRPPSVMNEDDFVRAAAVVDDDASGAAPVAPPPRRSMRKGTFAQDAARIEDELRRQYQLSLLHDADNNTGRSTTTLTEAISRAAATNNSNNKHGLIFLDDFYSIPALDADDDTVSANNNDTGQGDSNDAAAEVISVSTTTREVNVAAQPDDAHVDAEHEIEHVSYETTTTSPLAQAIAAKAAEIAGYTAPPPLSAGAGSSLISPVNKKPTKPSASGAPPPPPPPPPPPVAGGGGPPPPPPLPTSGAVPPPPPPPGMGGIPSLPIPPPPGAIQLKHAPTKRAVKPKAEVVQLFWKRVLVEPSVNSKPAPSTTAVDLTTAHLPDELAKVQAPAPAPVWRQLDEPSVDEDTLVNLFKKKPTLTPRKRKGGRKLKVGEEIKLALDPKRCQNVEIVLKNMHTTVEAISEALYTFDTANMSDSRLDQIESILPAKDEIEKLDKFVEKSIGVVGTPASRRSVDVTKLGSLGLSPPEAFMFQLGHLNAVQQRIALFRSHAELPEMIGAMLSELHHIEYICRFLLKSALVKELLKQVVAVGNYLNGGSYQRGQADGFQIEILPKLKETKSTSGKLNLLDFVLIETIKRMLNDYASNHVSAMRQAASAAKSISPKKPATTANGKQDSGVVDAATAVVESGVGDQLHAQLRDALPTPREYKTTLSGLDWNLSPNSMHGISNGAMNDENDDVDDDGAPLGMHQCPWPDPSAFLHCITVDPKKLNESIELISTRIDADASTLRDISTSKAPRDLVEPFNSIVSRFLEDCRTEYRRLGERRDRCTRLLRDAQVYFTFVPTKKEDAVKEFFSIWAAFSVDLHAAWPKSYRIAVVSLQSKWQASAQKIRDGSDQAEMRGRIMRQISVIQLDDATHAIALKELQQQQKKPSGGDKESVADAMRNGIAGKRQQLNRSLYETPPK